MGRMLDDIVDYLECPVCAEPLRLDPGVLRCPRGHSFDVARQGYVSLLTGSRPPGTADSAEMVAARAAFLAAGHYAPLERALVETVWGARAEGISQSPDGAGERAYGGSGRGSVPVVVDAGAGTGHYSAVVLDAVERGVALAFDVSKHAVRRAARAHPRVGAFVADVWRRLPIRDGVADVVVNVFAPRNGPEFRRILRPGGRVVVVTPAPGHLTPLVQELGLLSVDADKESRVARSLEGLAATGRRTVAFDLALGPDEVRAVVGMGPSAWHVGKEELEEKMARLFSRITTKNQGIVVTRAEFHLSTYEATPGAR